MAFDLACALRTLPLGITLTLAALCACEDTTSPVEDASAHTDAIVPDSGLETHDAALEAADADTPREASSLDAAANHDSASDGPTSRDAEAPPGDADAAANVARDSEPDAVSADATQGDAAQSDAAVAAPLCTAETCCMPLTKAEGSATCPKEACFSQRQSLRVTGEQGEKARLRCYGENDSRIDYNGSDGELHLNLDPQHCKADGSDLRPARGAYIVGHAIDAHNGDQLSAMVNIEPGSVKELSVREGRVRVVVEGPVVSSTSVAGLSFDCARGGTLPVGLCNCFFVGAGPTATVTLDVALLMP